MILLMALLAFGADLKPKDFDEYLMSFNLQERKDMKIKSYEMLEMIKENKAILVDIRFREEYESWRMPFSINIPLNELPSRLSELPKDKLIITACPHNDRSNMARIYLTMKGYNAKYLDDGLLKVADFLRGDNAVEFIEEMKNRK